MRRPRRRDGGGVWNRIQKAPASLLLKILLVLLVVLAFSSAVTVVFESRLTRSALQSQARTLLRSDLDILRGAYDDRHSTLVTGLRSAGQRIAVLDLDAARGRPQLIAELADIAGTLGLDALQLIDGDGRAIVSLGTSLAPLPPEALARATGAAPSRILRTTDGHAIQAALSPLSMTGQRFVIVGGYRFDDGAAFRMRGLVAQDVLLVAGGELVGATLQTRPEQPPLLGESGQLPDGAGSIELDGRETFIDYVQVAADDGSWSLPGAVGVAIPEPVAELDSSLLRNRVVAVAFLVGVTILLAYLFFRIITRPLLRLATTAQRIAAGESELQFAADTGDEIGVLADSLESMRSALEDQLHVIGDQAQALQEASERIVSAQDEERRRLASDLHDGVQQQLVMLRVQLGFARRMLEIEPSRAEEVWDRMAGEVDTIIERLRETSQNIFPSILQDRGLQGALYSLAGRSPVPLIVATEPDPFPRLDRRIESNAYFIVSEAVTNVLKHADAANISVSASLRDHRLRLAVADDGVGFEAKSPQAGIALSSMRDRVTALGGVLDVRSSAGEGTVVIAEFDATSVGGTLEVEQDRGDALVQVDGLAEPELAEDGVGVLLDRSLRDEEGVGDGRVVLPGRHQGEDL